MIDQEPIFTDPHRSRSIPELFEALVYSAVYFTGGLRQYGMRTPSDLFRIREQALLTFDYFILTRHNEIFRPLDNTSEVNDVHCALMHHAALASAAAPLQKNSLAWVRTNATPALQIMTQKLKTLLPPDFTITPWYDYLQNLRWDANTLQARPQVLKTSRPEPAHNFQHPLLTDHELSTVSFLAKALGRRDDELSRDGAKWLTKLVDADFNRPAPSLAAYAIESVAGKPFKVLGTEPSGVLVRPTGAAGPEVIIPHHIANLLVTLHKREREVEPPEFKKPLHDSRVAIITSYFPPRTPPASGPTGDGTDSQD